MNKINLDIKSPWAFLITLVMGVSLMTVVALAEDEVVGYTHDGIPVLESDIPEEDRESYVAKGLRSFEITLKKIAISEKYLNGNSVEISIGGKNYTIVLDCLITEYDTFEWIGIDGKLKIGHQVGVRRTPLKNWSNPDFSNSKIEKELLEKADQFDEFERQCTIQWIQKIKVLEMLQEEK